MPLQTLSSSMGQSKSRRHTFFCFYPGLARFIVYTVYSIPRLMETMPMPSSALFSWGHLDILHDLFQRVVPPMFGHQSLSQYSSSLVGCDIISYLGHSFGGCKYICHPFWWILKYPVRHAFSLDKLFAVGEPISLLSKPLSQSKESGMSRIQPCRLQHLFFCWQWHW